MKKIIFLFLLFPLVIFAQKTATIKGTILNKYKAPIEDVSISYLGKGTTTNSKGQYEIRIPIKKTTRLTFAHVSYKTVIKKFTVRGTRTINYAPKLT